MANLSLDNNQNQNVEFLNPASERLREIHYSTRAETNEVPIRMLIADDDYIFVEGVASLISSWDEFKLVGKAFTLKSAIELVKEKNPAVLMMGATFQGEGCADTVREICKISPDIRIMLLASMGESGHVLDALRAGARGFGSRDEMTPERLRSLFWGIACGDICFSGSLGTVLQGALLSGATPASTESVESAYFDSLDDRECTVLALLEEGLSNAEISQRLYLSEPTVKKTIGGIITKLHVSNRVQAAVLSARRGM